MTFKVRNGGNGKRDSRVKGGRGAKSLTLYLLDEEAAIENDAVEAAYEDDADDDAYLKYLDDQEEQEEEDRGDMYRCIACGGDDDEDGKLCHGCLRKGHRCRDCGKIYYDGLYDDWCDWCEYGDWLAGFDPDFAASRSRGIEKERNYDAAAAIIDKIAALQAEIKKNRRQLDELPHHKCRGYDWDTCDAPVPKAGIQCDRCRGRR